MVVVYSICKPNVAKRVVSDTPAPAISKYLHAEEWAIINTTETLEDSTMYVTREPCNGNPFHKRLHCCEQINSVGIKRVVMLSRKEIYEGGAHFLMDHGVGVIDLCHDELQEFASYLSSGLAQNSLKEAKFRRRCSKISQISKTAHNLACRLPPVYMHEYNEVLKIIQCGLQKNSL